MVNCADNGLLGVVSRKLLPAAKCKAWNTLSTINAALAINKEALFPGDMRVSGQKSRTS